MNYQKWTKKVIQEKKQLIQELKGEIKNFESLVSREERDLKIFTKFLSS